MRLKFEYLCHNRIRRIMKKKGPLDFDEFNANFRYLNYIVTK